MADKLPPRLEKDFMLFREALKETGMSVSTFKRKRKQGLFRCRRYLGRLIVRRTDVDRFLKTLEVA